MPCPWNPTIWLPKQDLHNDHASQCADTVGEDFTKFHPQLKNYRQLAAAERESVFPREKACDGVSTPDSTASGQP